MALTFPHELFFSSLSLGDGYWHFPLQFEEKVLKSAMRHRGMMRDVHAWSLQLESCFFSSQSRTAFWNYIFNKAPCFFFPPDRHPLFVMANSHPPDRSPPSHDSYQPERMLTRASSKAGNFSSLHLFLNYCSSRHRNTVRIKCYLPTSICMSSPTSVISKSQCNWQVSTGQFPYIEPWMAVLSLGLEFSLISADVKHTSGSKLVGLQCYSGTWYLDEDSNGCNMVNGRKHDN